MIYGIVWIGFIVLVATVPYSIPTNTSLPNVAAQNGFNTTAAYLVIAFWSVFCLISLALFNHLGWIKDAENNAPQQNRLKVEQESLLSSWFMSLVVGIVVMITHWPSFLARYGPYIEDKYFMTVLSRMQCGQSPYSDFEFLYGPLMIYPAHAWMNAVGFSLTSYFSYLAVMQASFYSILYFMFQKYSFDKSKALLAFIIFIPLVFDSILGLNSMGWRTLPALIAIIIVAKDPLNQMKGLLAGIFCGIQLAYSYEFGLVAIIVNIIIYGSAVFSESRKRLLVASSVFILTTLLTALLVIKLYTGEDFYKYFSITAHILKFAQESGMGSFSFYWTVNTVAMFGILSFFLTKVGFNWPKLYKIKLNFGDRLILGSLMFALGALKIAIQRADTWHITFPFLLLIMVVLWSVPSKIFTFSQLSKKILIGLTIIASLTRMIGILPNTSYFIKGAAEGAQDFVLGQSLTNDIQSRSYSVLEAQTNPDADLKAMAAFFASAQYDKHPVIFYGGNWWQSIYTGVCSAGYSFYQLMYSDQAHPMIDTVKKDPTTLIVMGIESYNYLFKGIPVKSISSELSMTKQIGAWTSSVHYQQKKPEKKIKEQIWKENLGDYLVLNYQFLQSFGDNVILQKSNHSQSN